MTRPNPSAIIPSLDTSWQREQRKARQRLEKGGLAGYADELHAGIIKWFECLLAEGTSLDLGRLSAVENQLLGNHPTYGQITRCRWEKGTTQSDNGLGLLLGEGRGMPTDLETKLKMMAAVPPPVETLVLVWPREAGLQPPFHELFPTGTRAVWDRFEKAGTTKRVQLRAIAPEDLAPWLALPSWLTTLHAEGNGPSPDLIPHFIAERTAALLNLVVPRS
jgi:hypothetical protein